MRRARRAPRNARPHADRDDDGTLLEVRIDELAAGGDGVGRVADGRVVFVPFTAPGDRARVRVESERPRFLHARVEELVEPSPLRTDPVCAVFGSCGGCAWQHVEYSAQLAAKAKIVADAFARIGGIALPQPVSITPSPAAYGYRSRARVLVERGRVGFRKRRSHALCATARCPILTPPLEAELAALAAKPPQRNGEWELASSDGESRATPRWQDVGDRITVRVGGDELAISPGVFVQANSFLREPLANAVLAAAGRGDLAYDFFAGAGFVTLGLARRFERVVAVESHRRSVSDLRANLEAAGLANVTVASERVEAVLAGAPPAAGRPRAAVLDPPRTGLPPDAADGLAALAPERIVYLACDPATQARDVRNLVGSGYGVVAVEAFDLFPQTPHVESLAVLEWSGARRPPAG